MEDKIIYGVTALYNNPDNLVKAVKAISSAGYKKFDVHTSYPVHGMPNAMRLKPSNMAYFALAFGLTGTLIAFLFISWTMGIDYKLVIGGKPYFSLPAFIPVMFEVTVLLASVGTALLMLFVFFKLPNNSHPLHDTAYMKKVSEDGFGVCIEAKDKNFDELKVTNFLLSLGSVNVNTICYDFEEINHKNKVFEPKFLGFLLFVFIIISGATYFSLNKLVYMQPFNWMHEQNRLDAQESSAMFGDGFGMRQPVEGTVARNQMPYPYSGHPELAVNIVNPLAPSKETFESGKKKFNIYCSPCHGYMAKGDSRLNGQFPNPPSLHSEKVTNWKDGQIFHVITEGQNSMPSYAKQILPEKRWAIVYYIRALQRAMNAKESDIK